MADSPYAHLPTVPEHWDTEDWACVFSGCGNASAIVWRAATPPTKEDVEPLAPEDIAEVTNIWSLSRQEYADQSMTALMRLKDGRWACVETWSDSSGYGCQDGTEWHIGAYDDVIRWGLSEEGRQHFDLRLIDGPGGDE